MRVAWLNWWQKAGDADCGRAAVSPQAPALRKGSAAEELAAGFLRREGLSILEHNARFRGGEIDLIALERDVLVFAEVRLRSNPRYGGAAESITPSKQRRILHAAECWLQGAGRAHINRPCRFDALLLDGLDEARIQWIRGAFDAS